MKTPNAQLQRLQSLIDKGGCLLPCGANKNPLIKAWPSHHGFSLSELCNFPGLKAVGARTGQEDGRILCIDIDGDSACKHLQDLGHSPYGSNNTWIIERSNDSTRFKIMFRLSTEQDAEISPFQAKIHTKNPFNGAKGEAVKVFYSRRWQVIVGGRHPSGENYIWLDGCGPEALSAPDAKWWAFIKECHRKVSETPTVAPQKTAMKNGTRRADPCPICGRHSGKGGSALWCSYTDRGLLFCMPGSTFSAPKGLRVGDVHNGWALKKFTQTADGPVHVFGNHDPEKLKRQNNAQAR